MSRIRTRARFGKTACLDDDVSSRFQIDSGVTLLRVDVTYQSPQRNQVVDRKKPSLSRPHDLRTNGALHNRTLAALRKTQLSRKPEEGECRMRALTQGRAFLR